MTAGPVRALLVALALLAGACGTGSGRLVLEATFDDVIDLVTRAHVRAGDVPIGTVTRIELTSDHRARVTMEVRPGTGLPAEVMAVLRQTALLGERYVDLVPLAEGGELTSGVIQQTRVVSDLEDLVGSGTHALAVLAADQLSAAVHAGAVTFGGRGATLGSFLDDVEAFVGAFDRRSHDVVRLLDGLDAMLVQVAPEAEMHADTLAELARAAAALEQEDERLLDALEDLRRLAVVGGRIMADHRSEMDDTVRRLRVIIASIVGIEGAFDNLLRWLPRHNLHVPNGIFLEHAQVWLDFVVCGIHDEPDNPANSCAPPNPGEAAPPHPDLDPDHPCHDRHEDCGYPEGVEPGTGRGGAR